MIPADGGDFRDMAGHNQFTGQEGGCGPRQSTGRANCRTLVNGVGPVSLQGY